jgi:hypothetical protein
VEKAMKPLQRLTSKSGSATLVRNGLAREESVSYRQIRGCISRLAGNLGATWKSASNEAAAGMVLLMLARNVDLGQYLNSNGWKLVVSFVTANPEIARNLSPRTIGEIFCYQIAARSPKPANC